MVVQLTPPKFPILTILVEEQTSKEIVLLLLNVFQIITAMEKALSVKDYQPLS